MSRPPARFEQFRRRAERLVEQPGRMQRLARQATRKLTRAGGERFAEFREQIRLAVRLLRAWLAGDYREVSKKTLVAIIAALLYFVVPLDVIPDFLLGWGLLDDAAVLAYVFTQLRHELDTFAAWAEVNEEFADESD